MHFFSHFDRYGKTLVMVILAIATKKKVIICAPTDAILHQLVSDLGKYVVEVTPEFLADPTISDDVMFFVGHPEQLTTLKFHNIALTQDISKIIIDEVHIIKFWGLTFFRDKFLKLKYLRNFAKQAHICGFTATATRETQKAIKECLGMKKSVPIVEKSPDRTNVYIEIKRRRQDNEEESVTEIIRPILANLTPNSARTIIYIPLKWSGFYHNMAVNMGVDSMVRQYHAPQTKEMKKKIAKDMNNPNGDIKCLFATQAYSMGANARDVAHVIHVGVPYTMEEYLQEIGRCARSENSFGKATMYYNSNDLSAVRKDLTKAMKSLCTGTYDCRREFILEQFGFKPDPEIQYTHECCDLCSTKCTCIVCTTRQIYIAPINLTLHDEGKEMCERILKKYVDTVNSAINNPMPSLISGLDSCLVSKIMKRTVFYSSVPNLAADFPEIVVPSSPSPNIYITNISKVLTHCNERHEACIKELKI